MESLDGLVYARSENDEPRGKLSSSKRHSILENPLTSPSNALLLSPTISPTLPLFIGTNERERRPLFASSAGSWKGASDIYDDYRYSRFSTARKMSGITTEYRFQRWQTAGGFDAFERGTFVPLKDGFHEVEGAFAAPVTAGARGRWYNGGRISRMWTRRWTTMVIGR
jgi:hypothetical protein